MSTAAAAQAFGFGTPFQAKIDFLRQKLRLPTERWDDIKGRANDHAFIVAGAAKADLLSDLQKTMVDRATDGAGLQAFRKDFKAIVAKHGWTGWTGEGTKEGEAWRTRIIYQTNMATSYSAGRYQQMSDPEVLALHPYWRYIHSDGVLNPRQEHLAWHGLTLRHDHPFWKSHWAPNGFGCHCRITSVTRKEGEASARAGLGEPPAGWDAINPKTGEQVGIGKGFGYTPGATWHPNLDKYPFDLAREVVAGNLKDGVFERWLDFIDTRIKAEKLKPEYAGLSGSDLSMAVRKALSKGENLPIAVLDARGLKALKVEKSDQSSSGFVTQTVLLSDDTAIKQSMHRAGQDLSVKTYLRLQQALDSAQYVQTSADSKLVYFYAADQWEMAVIKTTNQNNELYLVSMRKSSQREVDRAISNGATKWAA